MKRILVGTLWATTLALSSLKATPVTVEEIGISPYETISVNVSGFYSGPVLAGVNQLLVNHVLTNGFCIDPFHFSVKGPLSYNAVPITSAPKGHLLTAANAAIIDKLWALAYSPTMTAGHAAGLQIAIWMVVGGNSFSLTSGNDYGASLLLSTVEAPNYAGPSANLIGLTGPGQDFCIENPDVTDSGTTLSLFGLTIIGLMIFGLLRSRLQCSASDGVT